MKKIAYTIGTVLLLLIFSGRLQAQSEENRQVSGFHSVGSSGPFNVHININGTESLKIAASQDVINKIETVVEDGNLSIRFKKQRERWIQGNYGKIDIFVTARSLNALANSGSGSVKVDGDLTGDNVDVSLSGSGDIISALRSEKLTAALSGSGSIRLSGTAGEANIRISGSGSVISKHLSAGTATVSIAGSGNAYLAAEKSISANIVGSGNVVYTGNATIADRRTIGSGSISKAD